MAFWQEDDYFARRIHGLCAVPLLVFAAFEVYLLLNSYGMVLWRGSGSAVATYLSYRLLWYAITGKRCINRDDWN
jgi:hypothetical protein